MASGATLSVAANVNVLIASYQTIADNGTLTFGTGDTVTFGGAATIAVNPSGTNPGGTLTASGDTFTTNGSGNNYLKVSSGAHLTASNSTFSLDNLYLDSGSLLNSGDITGNAFNLTRRSHLVNASSLTYATSKDRSFNAVHATGGHG